MRVNLKRILKEEYLIKKDIYNIFIGNQNAYEISTNTRFYEINLCYNNTKFIISIINEHMGIEPQVELCKEYLLIGNNDEFVMLNLIDQNRISYRIFPIFYQFFIIKDNIYIVGELSVICIKDKKILWEEHFQEIIGIDSISDDYLVLTDFNGIKIQIDLNMMENKNDI